MRPREFKQRFYSSLCRQHDAVPPLWVSKLPMVVPLMNVHPALLVIACDALLPNAHCRSHSRCRLLPMARFLFFSQVAASLPILWVNSVRMRGYAKTGLGCLLRSLRLAAAPVPFRLSVLVQPCDTSVIIPYYCIMVVLPASPSDGWPRTPWAPRYMCWQCDAHLLLLIWLAV
ncbi:hypothetical protein FKP32DRAFT_426164 [Trametes sanguinea]|nr:hypothetical protein FKP32DRAFT_426164 [Trametes sanguinea]